MAIAGSAHSDHSGFAVGVGCFPNARRPNILWAGIRASDNVRPSFRRSINPLAALGFPLEKREFFPHVTLGRFDRDPNAGNLQICG